MANIDKIPKYLFRGDSDPEGNRKLRASQTQGVLLTNLTNGGNGREIFKHPLNHLMEKHIVTGWEKTHFLSFSRKKEIAFHYAIIGMSSKLPNEYMEYLTQDNSWDFKVFTFSRDMLIQNSFKEINQGMFYCEYLPMEKRFLPTFKIILIDVESYLRNDIFNNKADINAARKKAERDMEWLILPLMPSEDGYTGLMDKGCLTGDMGYLK